MGELRKGKGKDWIGFQLECPSELSKWESEPRGGKSKPSGGGEVEWKGTPSCL